MWLQEFHKLFPEATERQTGRRQDLEALERSLTPARSHMKVGSSELRIIESSAAWSYANWWPALSKTADSVVELPKNLELPDAKRQAVRALQDCLKHIEVVSVVLRFLCPEEFGILSPPVTWLLNLAPADDHVEYYLRYLNTLHDLARHSRGLRRAADIDMALWSAFYLSLDPAWASLKEEMEQDRYFQEIRLKNLVESLGRFGRETDQQRLLLAKAIVKHDHLTAALIAARSYESLVLELAQRLGVSPGPKSRQTKVGSLVEKLGREPLKLRSLRLSPDRFDRWWHWRNDAVHPDRQLSKRDAEKFVQEIGQLWEELHKSGRL